MRYPPRRLPSSATKGRHDRTRHRHYRLSTRQILRLSASLLTELIARGVLRSRNAPVGDLAETLVARAYNGQLPGRSERSWDVRTSDGLRLQVKSRMVGPHTSGSQVYSVFRSWDFDACVFVQIDSHTYDVVHAAEVPAAGVQQVAGWSSHTNGARVRVNQHLVVLPGAKDVTALLRAALDTVDSADRPSVSLSPPVTPPAGAGACLCGCEQVPKPGRDFVVTHDRRAELR
ncbi:DUF6998 domain-containing protein [Georgenia faecalis]|uniref:DUF6998 domain-containing protein n=1 Tax=Georgenia faecalis TaxID=2483799 RepID=A0ABV9D9S6_9MICO